MAAIRLTACTASIFGAIDIQMKLRLGMAGQTRRHTMASPMPAQADKESAIAAAKRRNGLALTTILLSLVPFVLWGLLYLINVVIISHLILTSPFSEIPTLENIVALTFLVAFVGSLVASISAIVTGRITLRRSKLSPLRKMWARLVAACIVISALVTAIHVLLGAVVALFAWACSGPTGC